MASRDLTNRTKGVTGLAPAVRTALALSAKCDTQGFEGVIARFQSGTFGDTVSGSLYTEAELQESDDDSTYTAVADADLEFPLWQGLAARVGTATGTFFQSKTTGAADVAGLYEVGYRGSKRYIKVNVRLTGTHTNGTPTAVSFSQGQPAFTPAY
jgi:hypothetical protein